MAVKTDIEIAREAVKLPIQEVAKKLGIDKIHWCLMVTIKLRCLQSSSSNSQVKKMAS